MWHLQISIVVNVTLFIHVPRILHDKYFWFVMKYSTQGCPLRHFANLNCLNLECASMSIVFLRLGHYFDQSYINKLLTQIIMANSTMDIAPVEKLLTAIPNFSPQLIFPSLSAHFLYILAQAFMAVIKDVKIKRNSQKKNEKVYLQWATRARIPAMYIQ